MSSLSPTQTAKQWEREELAAQRIACGLLVKGCERALFQFGLMADDTTADTKQLLLDRRAAEITGEILGSWRATFDILCKLERNQRWPNVETLEGWLQVDPSLIEDSFTAQYRPDIYR